MKIWKMGYFPFTMGGELYRPIATEFPDDQLGELYELGQGFQGYLVNVNKKFHVIEKISGAFVGDTIEQVRKDIAESDLEVMRDQVMDALKTRDTLKCVESKYFWQGIN